MNRDACADAIVAWEMLGLELRTSWYMWWFEMAEIALPRISEFA